MKKIFALILAIALLCPAVLAESIDLSGLSFAELAALRDRCQLAMMKTDTWQEVDVPQGVYQVGVHIPAGTWTIRCKTGYATTVEWGDALSADGQDIDNRKSTRHDFEGIYNPEDKYYDSGNRTDYTFTVQDGDYIIIDSAPATFTPGGVTPSFTFK